MSSSEMEKTEAVRNGIVLELNRPFRLSALNPDLNGALFRTVEQGA